MTSNPTPPKRSATKKKIQKEEQPPQIIEAEPPATKLKRLSEEQYKKRLEEQFKERQEQKQRQEEERKKQEAEEERKKQEAEEERKKQEEEEEPAENADLVEYAPILPEKTNGENMPEIVFKFVMEIMPQLIEEINRLKRYKGTKKNIHLKIPYGFNFD